MKQILVYLSIFFISCFVVVSRAQALPTPIIATNGQFQQCSQNFTVCTPLKVNGLTNESFSYINFMGGTTFITNGGISYQCSHFPNNCEEIIYKLHSQNFDSQLINGNFAYVSSNGQLFFNNKVQGQLLGVANAPLNTTIFLPITNPGYNTIIGIDKNNQLYNYSYRNIYGTSQFDVINLTPQLGVTLQNAIGMVYTLLPTFNAQGSGVGNLYISNGSTITQCALPVGDGSLYEQISCQSAMYLVGQPPLNIYLDQDVMGLDIVYQNQIQRCPINSYNGTLMSCTTLYQGNNITSLGYMN